MQSEQTGWTGQPVRGSFASLPWHVVEPSESAATPGLESHHRHFYGAHIRPEYGPRMESTLKSFSFQGNKQLGFGR